MFPPHGNALKVYFTMYEFDIFRINMFIKVFYNIKIRFLSNSTQKCKVYVPAEIFYQSGNNL